MVKENEKAFIFTKNQNMKMENDYHVIINNDPSELATQVAKYLDEGDELVGGVSITYDPRSSKIIYAQALINKKSNPNHFEK